MSTNKYQNFIRVIYSHISKLSKFPKTNPLRFKKINKQKIRPVPTVDRKLPAFPVLLSGFFSYFFDKSGEVSEDQLLSTIKRSLVYVQRQDFEKAEEMLNGALHLAKQLNSAEGITFIYDVMATLAMEQEDFIKASHLLSNVMKRLRDEGHTEDSSRILHICSKMAHVSLLQGDYKQARVQFKSTIDKIEKKLSTTDDIELRELLGQTNTRYGQLFMKLEDFKEAKRCFLGAYEAYTKVYGRVNSEAIAVLHYLSLSCKYLNNNGEAIKYMEEAIDLAEQLQEISDVALMKAQLGLLYLKVNMLDRAKESCRYAMKLGKKYDNYFGVVKAKECLNKIRENAAVTKEE